MFERTFGRLGGEIGSCSRLTSTFNPFIFHGVPFGTLLSRFKATYAQIGFLPSSLY
jgi:hypothetical protein